MVVRCLAVVGLYFIAGTFASQKPIYREQEFYDRLFNRLSRTVLCIRPEIKQKLPRIFRQQVQGNITKFDVKDCLFTATPRSKEHIEPFEYKEDRELRWKKEADKSRYEDIEACASFGGVLANRYFGDDDNSTVTNKPCLNWMEMFKVHNSARFRKYSHQPGAKCRSMNHHQPWCYVDLVGNYADCHQDCRDRKAKIPKYPHDGMDGPRPRTVGGAWRPGRPFSGREFDDFIHP